MSDGASDTTGSENQAKGANPQSEDAVCRNCGAPLAGEYCHECGTRRSCELKLRDLGGRFLRSVLDVDDYRAGLRRLFINGLNSPGTLARQYVKGKRKRTVNPASGALSRRYKRSEGDLPLFLTLCGSVTVVWTSPG